MPLSLHFLPSFERSRKNLDPEQQEIIELIVRALFVYFDSHCTLSEAQKVASRFFYKQLRRPYYEAGVEGKMRVVVGREKSNCFLMFAGNHDQVKRFLASQ